MKNNKGSALLFALIACLILSVIGAGLIVVTLEATRSAKTVNVSTQLTQDGESELTAIIQAFKNKVYEKQLEKYFDNSTPPGRTYQGDLDAIKNDIKDEFSDVQLEIEPLTGFTEGKFSRAYQFTMTKTVTEGGKEISKNFSSKLFLSPTPSLSQFAAGSKELTALRGNVQITGDVYGDRAVLSGYPYYYIPEEGQKKTKSTSTYFPTINGSLYLNKEISCFGNLTQAKKTDLIEPELAAKDYVTTGYHRPFRLNIYSVDNYLSFYTNWQKQNAMPTEYFKDPSYMDTYNPNNEIKDYTTIMRNRHQYVDTNYMHTMLQAILSKDEALKLNPTQDINTIFQPTTYKTDPTGSNPNMITTGTPYVDEKILNKQFPSQPVINSNRPKNQYNLLDEYQGRNSNIYVIEADINLEDNPHDKSDKSDLYDESKWRDKDILLLTDFINWPIAQNPNAFPLHLEYYSNKNNRTFKITQDLNLNSGSKETLLFVDGNLEICAEDKTINITGNIIVNGKLIVHGKNTVEEESQEKDQVNFNANIYVNGYNYYKNEKEEISYATLYQAIPGTANGIEDIGIDKTINPNDPAKIAEDVKYRR